MHEHDNKYEWRQSIFRAVKNDFNENIGKLTHQKISEEWHFRGLAFVRDEMTYVFGFNLGFFRKDNKLNDFEYDYVGMNTLVRTNGINSKLRNKFKEFFEKHLSNWLLGEKNIYTSFRGGIGIELPRIVRIDTFGSDEEIIAFLRDSIIKLSGIWSQIASNPDNIFSHIVRGAPPWDMTIIELALNKSQNINKP